MAAVSVERYATTEQVEQACLDPLVRERLSTDFSHPAFRQHPLISYCAAYVDGRFVGVFLAVKFSAVEVEVHALLFREAARASRELGRAFLQLAFADPLVQRVSTYVFSNLKTARNWLLKLGFEYEGCKRDAARKIGRPLDVWVFGMTRKDWCTK